MTRTQYRADVSAPLPPGRSDTKTSSPSIHFKRRPKATPHLLITRSGILLRLSRGGYTPAALTPTPGEGLERRRPPLHLPVFVTRCLHAAATSHHSDALPRLGPGCRAVSLPPTSKGSSGSQRCPLSPPSCDVSIFVHHIYIKKKRERRRDGLSRLFSRVLSRDDVRYS